MCKCTQSGRQRGAPVSSTDDSTTISSASAEHVNIRALMRELFERGLLDQYRRRPSAGQASSESFSN